MAKLNDQSLLYGLSGALGKQLVIKQYKDKVVVTAYPDMSNVVPSVLQKQQRSLFKKAVAFASEAARNPSTRALYEKKLAPGQTVYRYALKEYLSLQKESSNK